MNDSTRSANWGGSIPVLLTLAPTSLSSPTLPLPLHILLSRHTYLHVGLQSAVERLHKFAPTTLSFTSGLVQNEPDPGSSFDKESSSNEGNNEQQSSSANGTPSKEERKSLTLTRRTSSSQSFSYPVCWFEDEVTQIALRWHMFVGALFDAKRDRQLPWRIRLHFTASSYPTSQILPLEEGMVLAQVQNYFKNSLKQALCLQYGNSKVCMNVTKESHGRLWESISTSNYQLYQQVNDGLQQLIASKLELIPIRLYVNARPPIQKCCRASDKNKTLGMLLAEWLPDYYYYQNNQPSAILDGKDSTHNGKKHDDEKDSTTTTTTSSSTTVVVPVETVVFCHVGGIEPPLETRLIDLWTNLCHPDHFLYILVAL